MSETLISAKNLSVGFPIGGGIFNKQILKAIDNVSVHIDKGSFFGLVGESGSGKTTLGRAFSILFQVHTVEAAKVVLDLSIVIGGLAIRNRNGF